MHFRRTSSTNLQWPIDRAVHQEAFFKLDDRPANAFDDLASQARRIIVEGKLDHTGEDSILEQELETRAERFRGRWRGDFGGK
jgi:hypothetical protein